MSTQTQPQPNGLLNLIAAIQKGAFTPVLVPSSEMQVFTPWGIFTVSNYMYLSDASAAALAEILGGTVVQENPSGNNSFMPVANYIQLNTPGGTLNVNAASLAAYTAGRGLSATQLAFDLSQCVNQGNAVVQNGGGMIFPMGWAGPAIPGFNYPPGQPVGSDGNLINPGTIF